MIEDVKYEEDRRKRIEALPQPQYIMAQPQVKAQPQGQAKPQQLPQPEIQIKPNPEFEKDKKTSVECGF